MIVAELQRQLDSRVRPNTQWGVNQFTMEMRIHRLQNAAIRDWHASTAPMGFSRASLPVGGPATVHEEIDEGAFGMEK